MATLSVWKFDTPGGADGAETTLQGLVKQDLLKVHDAAVVSWPREAKKPKTRQLHNMAGVGALGGMFWGLLFGILFFIPLIGVAIGAGVGALAGSMTDVGIDDEFIRSVRSEIKPGTSALFVMTSDAVMDRVADAFRGQHAQLLETNLSREEENRLREVFSE